MSRSTGPKNFIDKLRFYVRAGDGAIGNPVQKGKGGNGGSIYLQADENYSLNKADTGQPPSAKLGYTLGVDGKTKIIKVPTGVSVHESTMSKTIKGADILLGDLDKHDQKLLVAKGGIGGMPLTNYLPTSGEKKTIVLDLKLVSDVGFLGFPNAGKSSLLQALTGAKAKVASYPFTTLKPQISSMRFSDTRKIDLTDLPGLADAAAKFDENSDELPPLQKANFLKHLERNKCIMVVLDAVGFQATQYAPWRSISDSALILASQIERFSYGKLVGKPTICVINKIDLLDTMDDLNRVKDTFLSGSYVEKTDLPKPLIPRYPFKFNEVFLVSAKENTNIEELRLGIRQKLDDLAEEARRSDLQSRKELSIDVKLDGKLPVVV